MSDPVLCRDCDHVHSDTRKAPPYKWRCLRHPIKLEPPRDTLFVDPDWRPDPPYLLCYAANQNGDCTHFQPRRTAPTGEA
jgi:hypothetical protein